MPNPGADDASVDVTPNVRDVSVRTTEGATVVCHSARNLHRRVGGDDEQVRQAHATPAAVTSPATRY